MKPTVVVAAVVVIATLAVAGLTLLGLQPHQQPGHTEFCFAEWCVAPAAMSDDGGSSRVGVVVRSDARGVTQRPDHPQAWLVDEAGHEVGGPQPALDRPLGPGASFTVDLVFAGASLGCSTFVVAEGAWPPFLGLGYTPSPFTERASWRLCRSGS
jgi:hypothetical protein